MPKDKIVFVRLTKDQTRALDQFVKEKNKRSTVTRLSRSDVIRRAIEEWIIKERPKKDPSLLSTIFAEEEIDRAFDQ